MGKYCSGQNTNINTNRCSHVRETHLFFICAIVNTICIASIVRPLEFYNLLRPHLLISSVFLLFGVSMFRDPADGVISCANDYVDFVHPSGPGNVKFADRLLEQTTQDL